MKGKEVVLNYIVIIDVIYVMKKIYQENQQDKMQKKIMREEEFKYVKG